MLTTESTPFPWIFHCRKCFSCSVYVVSIIYRVVLLTYLLKIKLALDISFVGAKKAEVRVFRLIHQGQGK